MIENAIKPMNKPCRPIEITCVQPKFSSLDQISLTRTGFTSKGRGACLVGENNSFRRVPNPPKPSTQPVESLLFDCPFGTGRCLKNSPTFPQNPSPYSEGMSEDFTSPRIFTGRSKRNCFRFDQKLSGISIGGRPNRGTGELRAAFAPATSAFGRCDGPRLSIDPDKFPALRADRLASTVRCATTSQLDAIATYLAPIPVRFPPGRIGCTFALADTILHSL